MELIGKYNQIRASRRVIFRKAVFDMESILKEMREANEKRKLEATHQAFYGIAGDAEPGFINFNNGSVIRLTPSEDGAHVGRGKSADRLEIYDWGGGADFVRVSR